MGFGYSEKLLASQSNGNRSSSSPFNIAKSEKTHRQPVSHAYERPGIEDEDPWRGQPM
ncbi:hypothetical protein BS47DRAFT_1341338 [Hydnum rufescens UP504]|uniref:Uncharacterized protein n=1 Tax=Hydnum rufescens UP504 TaxID=1448309 RepID=A0A9P6B1Y1_9AGAM|nr:hypothetical protein BS47DRAFT_1341338 [Hydnum rufescens UP504]